MFHGQQEPVKKQSSPSASLERLENPPLSFTDGDSQNIYAMSLESGCCVIGDVGTPQLYRAIGPSRCKSQSTWPLGEWAITQGFTNGQYSLEEQLSPTDFSKIFGIDLNLALWTHLWSFSILVNVYYYYECLGNWQRRKWSGSLEFTALGIASLQRLDM